jgi:hypothetical protein
VCPVKVFVLVQLVVSHNITVVSPEPLARTLPEGLKATEITSSVCPVKILKMVQLLVPHTITLLSYEPPARTLPEGVKAIELTH